MLKDEDLALSLQEGSEAALEALVRRYHEPLFGYVYRQTHHTALTDDLVQETFIRVCTRISQYRYPQPFRPWLYRIALNLCRDYWKSAVYSHEGNSPPLDEELHDENGVESIYAWQETRQELVAAIQRLDAIYKDALILRFYQELRIDEIAEVLDTPVGTIKWRIFQGLKLLKKALEKGGETFVWEEHGED